MTEYVLLCFDGPRLARGEKFFAPNDEAAVNSVMTRLEGRSAELWAGDRKVCGLPAEAEHYPAAGEYARPA